jgi:p-aminobenzoyl-glutamate transporter AbgT
MDIFTAAEGVFVGGNERPANETRHAKSRPEAASCRSNANSYFIAPEEAVIALEAASIADDAAEPIDVTADEAEPIADDAASIAVVAAAEAAMLAEAAASVAGAIVAAGVVVVVSSFLLQAAKETAAASETMSNAVFIFLLDSGGSNKICGNLFWLEDPFVRRQGMRGTSHA